MLLFISTGDAEAAGSIDIRNTLDMNLAVQFGVAGMFTLLAGLMILYHWYRHYRPKWYEDLKK